MIRESIIKLSKKQNLTYQEAEEVMDEIMSGKATPVQMSAYLTALALKGETIDEITASAAGMRAHCIKLLHDMDVLEIVGTGGDGSNSFNISTTASLVIAAGGVPVAKHGNRAASSKSGAADVLEALGVKITIPPEKSQELLEKIGICFLFAQNYHIAMKYVAPIRKELGIRTVFNILGPLSNPAGANMELMGVYDEALVEPLAQVMANLGVTRGMVVFGQDSLDEISMSYVRKNHSLFIGEEAAENIKIKIGTACQEASPRMLEVKGRNVITGLPKVVTLTSEEIRIALKDATNQIVETVHGVLEKTPPELAADIVDRGIVLTGGGALLHGMDTLIEQKTGVSTLTVQDAMSAVVVGTGKYAEVITRMEE